MAARPFSSGTDRPLPIPDGLASLPPGAELAEALAHVDERRVSGFDTVEVLKAAYRQSCHDRARFLAVLLEVGLREHFSGDSVRRLEVPDEFSPDEARAALVWSRRRADSTFELAWGVHRRLPQLGEAMLRGDLDEPRAAAFIRWTAGLTAQQAETVCSQLVPGADRLTVGALIEQIQRLVLAIDPEWAQKRYAEAVRRRRVVGTRNEDGTANVSGLDLPLDRAAAGCERIDDLARACKRAGDKRPIDHIRTDLFLGSLDGSFEGLRDREIVAHVLDHPFVDPNDNQVGEQNGERTERASDATADHAAESAAERAEQSAGPKPARTMHRGAATPRPGMAQRPRPPRPGNDRPRPGQGESVRPEPGQHEPAPNEPAPDGPASCEPESREPAPRNGVRSTSALPKEPVGPRSHGVNRPPTTSTGRRTVRELRVEVTTLLGLDEHPAQVPGWGIVHADLAREMVSGMLAGQWRFAICTDDGRLLYSGLTRHRPCAPSARPARDDRLGGIVELQITRSRLSEIAAAKGSLGLWSALIADLDAQTSRHLRATDTAIKIATDNRRRHAGAALRRYVQIRGRFCSWPGCRMPATRTDQDHAADWAGGGSTSEDNLHLACRHDHRAKHHGGWRVTMPESELILWDSPLGHTYPSRLPPVMFNVVDPQPRDWPAPPPEAIVDDTRPLMTSLKPDSPGSNFPPPPSPQTSRPREHTPQPNNPESHGKDNPSDEHTQACAPSPPPPGPLFRPETDTPPF
ncbi:HNH endonuclease [Planotetraspora phitsanulokensis]|nr:HNH endonuclease [Planotetraspora phitsanulokensis]